MTLHAVEPRPSAQASAEAAAPLRRSFPIVLSAPSGAGKTSVAREIQRRFPDLDFAVSWTTRGPRGGERDGIDYVFVDEARFLEAVDGDAFAEWARVHGRYYGTPRAAVDEPLAGGRHVLLDVDVQGARSLLALYPFAVSVFLLPPSMRHMADRLRARGTEEEGALRVRLDEAVREIAQAKQYQYVLVNDELERTIDRFEHILRAEEQRRSRIANWSAWIGAAFGPASVSGGMR